MKTILFLFLRKDVARCMWCDEFASDKKVDADSKISIKDRVPLREGEIAKREKTGD